MTQSPPSRRPRIPPGICLRILRRAGQGVGRGRGQGWVERRYVQSRQRARRSHPVVLAHAGSLLRSCKPRSAHALPPARPTYRRDGGQSKEDADQPPGGVVGLLQVQKRVLVCSREGRGGVGKRAAAPAATCARASPQRSCWRRSGQAPRQNPRVSCGIRNVPTTATQLRSKPCDMARFHQMQPAAAAGGPQQTTVRVQAPQVQGSRQQAAGSKAVVVWH